MHCEVRLATQVFFSAGRPTTSSLEDWQSNVPKR
jgi:hypothetical protein